MRRIIRQTSTGFVLGGVSILLAAPPIANGQAQEQLVAEGQAPRVTGTPRVVQEPPIEGDTGGVSPRDAAVPNKKPTIDRAWLEDRLHQPRQAFYAFKPAAFAPQHLYVQVDPALSPVDSEAVISDVAVKILWRSKAIPGLYRIEVAAGTELGACGTLLDRPDVVYAEPDYVKRFDTDPNDSRWDEQWNMRGNDGCRAQWAWDEFTGSSSMKIAIIDSGFRTNHSDLVDNLWVNPGEIAGNGVDDDNNGFVDDVNGYDFAHLDGDPYDDGATCGGHGTHVAGTAGARGNNSNGVAGVNWRCQLVLIKIGTVNPNDASDCDLYRTTEALEYAFLTAGCRVSNNSYGGYTFDQSQYNMIAAAGASGHVFVASAGNGGADGVGDNNDVTPHYPDGYDLDNIISVANMDTDRGRASSSNYGTNTVDIAAPGTDILSTIETGSYGLKSGTSMASPHVAGAVGLILAQHPLTSAEICRWRIINSRIANSAFNQTVSGGELNVHKALGIWLEWGAGGSQYGTRFQPVPNMADALDKTPWTGVLNIKPSFNSWTGTINQYIRICAPEGAAGLGW